MGLEKLSIFSKDTDATEALKGYEYQKLRALENWLDNYLAKNNEVIYCDYEEDIFQRDLDQWSSKFTQVKLYSSKNFSFTSVEVTKAISHFFMLFIKGEYKFDGVEFIFETNVAVAKKYGDNEADLLQNWKNSQDNLDDTLLKQCAEKTKKIVTEYAQKAGKGIKDEIILQQIEEAKIILEEVSDEVWTDFAKTIKWSFSDITAEEAMENVISRINDKIAKTNIPAANERKESVFARLYYAVSEKSVQVESEDRKLEIALLDSLLLDTGSEEDKGYNEDYQTWAKVTEIKYFRTAEFYKVINLSYYCRYAPYLEHHAKTWIDLLQKYIDFPNIPPHYKQKAIYEIIWANLRPKKLDIPDGTLLGYQDYIREYFSQFQNFTDSESLEDTASLLGIVLGSAAFEQVDIPFEEIETWRNQLIHKVKDEISIAKDPNQICYFHAILAMLKLQNASDPKNSSNMDDAFFHFDSILDLLDVAQQYNVYQLTTRISEYIKILIHLEHKIENIERLEEFSDKLMPYAAKKTTDHDMAHIYILREV